jgi:general secretion pathway protein I
MKNSRKPLHFHTIKKQQAGFTLVEVIVALAVVAVALGAIVQTVGNANYNAARLTEETMARWVASNHLTRLRLEKTWPDLGTEKGEESMAGRTWYWQQTIIQTPDTDLRKIEVRVGLQEGSQSALIVAYLSKELAPFNPQKAPRLTGQNNNANGKNGRDSGQGNQGGQNNSPNNRNNVGGNGQNNNNSQPNNDGQPPPIRVR